MAEPSKISELLPPLRKAVDADQLLRDWQEARSEDWDRTEAKAREESLRRQLYDNGMPERCLEAAAAPKDTLSMQAARRWASNPSTFLLFLGAAGAGKSVAASWLLLERARKTGRIGRFLRAGEASRISASDYDVRSLKAFEAWCECGALVLDDLGTERAWDGWLSRVDELLDRRYGDRLPTIITSNLDATTFKARYGERITDRIRHDGLVVSAGKESLRAQKSVEATP